MITSPGSRITLINRSISCEARELGQKRSYARVNHFPDRTNLVCTTSNKQILHRNTAFIRLRVKVQI